MVTKERSRAVAWGLVLWLLGGGAPAQASFQAAVPAASEQVPGLAEHSAEDRSPEIALTVIATRGGKPLLDLPSSQIALRVSDRPIGENELRVSGPLETPVSLLIVLDAINMAHEDLASAEEGLRGFLLDHGGRLEWPTSVVLFTDHPLDGGTALSPETSRRALSMRRLPVTTEGQALVRGLEESDPGLRRITQAQGGAGQEEQVSLSLKAMAFLADAEAKVPGAKVVVWISPGWPLMAGSPRNHQQLFDTISYFSSSLRRAQVVMDQIDPRAVTRLPEPSSLAAVPMRPDFGAGNQHSVSAPAPSGPEYWKSFVPPVVSARAANPNDLTLQVLATQSGGLVLGNEQELGAQLRRCAEEAKGLHVLRFTRLREAVPGSYQAVSVRARSSDVQLRMRQGYYEER